MSHENVEVVERLIAAVNERDLGGSEAIRRFFADLQDTLPDFRLTIERAEAIGRARVLAFVKVVVSGRASGIPAAAMIGGLNDPSAAGHIPTANVYDFAGGKIASIRVFLDRHEALEAVGLRE